MRIMSKDVNKIIEDKINKHYPKIMVLEENSDTKHIMEECIKKVENEQRNEITQENTTK
jgi:hypothetical protein